MSTVVKHWTYDDYAALPDDGKRYEVIDGELILVPAPPPRHQFVSLNIVRALLGYLDDHPIGQLAYAPIDVLLAPTTVVQPDIVFVRSDRLSIIGEKNLQGPPDLCIEILSDSTRRVDETKKRALYERFGVQEYWIVDPVAQWVKVWRGGAMTQLTGSDVLESPLLPGFALDIERLFR